MKKQAITINDHVYQTETILSDLDRDNIQMPRLAFINITDKGKAVCELKFTIFDPAVYDDAEELGEYTDDEAADWGDPMMALYFDIENGGEVCGLNDATFGNLGIYGYKLIIMDRLFVHEEYRKNGIGSYIMTNLFDILAKYLDTNAFCVFTCAKPDDKTAEMKKLQIDTAIKCGFTKLPRAESLIMVNKLAVQDVNFLEDDEF